MAFVNLKKKEVQVKVVYYGPGRGGKTTNLEYIYKKFNKRIKTEMVTIKTHGDRTLFFDFLPFDIGKIKGYDDAIVFVADSMKIRREKNILALKNLQKNLISYKKSIFKIPLVLQYNKRDLADQGIPVLPIEMLEKDLNSQLKAPSFEASAMSGENVVQTMKQIISMTMRSLQRDLK